MGSHLIVFIEKGSSQYSAKMCLMMQELDRLKSVVPSCQGGNVSQMEVILEAIQYIQDLQGRLGFQEFNRLKSVVPNCQGEDVSQMDVILQAIDYLKDLQRKLGN